MKFLKHTQILFFVLFPACLLGMEVQHNSNHGCWSETDKKDNKVVLEWSKITDYKKLLEAERKLIPVFAAAFAYEMTEIDTFYEKVTRATKLLEKRNDDMMSKYLQSKKVKTRTCFVVTIRNERANKILGYAIFHLKPKFGKGFVWLELLAIIPSAQGRGLSRKLVFSILEIVSNVNQIALGVRYENTKAQAVYKALGFSVIQEQEVGLVLVFKQQ